MRKILLTLFVLSLAGCATAPMPTPMPPPPNGECIWIPGKGCKKITASDSGATVRGVRDNTQTEEDPK
jgi:hypothetical protein